MFERLWAGIVVMPMVKIYRIEVLSTAIENLDDRFQNVQIGAGMSPSGDF